MGTVKTHMHDPYESQPTSAVGTVLDLASEVASRVAEDSSASAVLDAASTVLDAAGEVASDVGEASPTSRTAAGTVLEVAGQAAKEGGQDSPLMSTVSVALNVAGKLVSHLRSSAGRPALDRVRYMLEITVGPAVAFEVRRMKLEEQLGEPYALELDLVTTDPGVNTDELLGASCELRIERGRAVRFVHGIIDQVEDQGCVQDRLLVHVRVVPALRLLEHEVDTRIFQGQDVKEILREVLGVSLSQYGRELDADTHLVRTYNKRDYCTQFRESTLAFCLRLMEEEGIALAFATDEDGRRETLVLVDDNDAYPDVELVAGEQVPVIPDRAEEADRESIQVLRWKRQRRPNKIVTRGYNAKVPDALDEAVASTNDAHHPTLREVYLHDERRQIVDDPTGDPVAERFTGERLAQRQPMAKNALERWTGETKLLEGRSNVTGFLPGRMFQLGEHPQRDLDDPRVLLTQVVHEGNNEAEAEQQYANQFTCIPAAHAFRPACRREAPRVSGVQTAIVVGPEDQEIHVDPLGRIQLGFHWDRRQPDEISTCWVPVAQSLAGPQWGSMFIPRVGMEVIVQFLDGNPDRPIVAGCLYNGANMPPLGLPDEKTKSVLRTSSSPGGDGYNELAFEDAAGSEEVTLRAQRNLNVSVGNEYGTVVHGRRHDAIEGDRSTTVGGDDSHVVHGNLTERVGHDAAVTIEGESKQTVGKNETVNVLGARETTIAGKLTECFDGGRQTTITRGDAETVTTGDKSVDVASGALLVATHTKVAIVQGDEHSLVLEHGALLRTAGDFTITNGKVSVRSEGGVLELTAAEELRLMCGDASITLASDGSIEITATKKATIGTSGNTFSAEPTGVTIEGFKISSNGTSAHEVQGGIVRIG